MKVLVSRATARAQYVPRTSTSPPTCSAKAPSALRHWPRNRYSFSLHCKQNESMTFSVPKSVLRIQLDLESHDRADFPTRALIGCHAHMTSLTANEPSGMVVHVLW